MLKISYNTVKLLMQDKLMDNVLYMIDSFSDLQNEFKVQTKMFGCFILSNCHYPETNKRLLWESRAAHVLSFEENDVWLNELIPL